MYLRLVVLAVASLVITAEAGPRELLFLRDGEEVRRLDLEALKEAAEPELVTVDDPYYETRKRFRALPLEAVLAAGFGTKDVAGLDLVFHALDGYARPARGAQVAAGGGYLAFADADHASGADPGWQPIDRRQVDPGPFYVVWTGEGRNDPHRHPWPYQVAAIESVTFEERFPHTAPSGLPEDAPAREGYAIFRDQCFSCHSINGEGGKVGPELNVPRSIVEYRPVEQLKEFIRDPGSFRYTSMPSHEHLSAAELDQLIAYFEAMKTRKRDPGRR